MITRRTVELADRHEKDQDAGVKLNAEKAEFLKARDARARMDEATWEAFSEKENEVQKLVRESGAAKRELELAVPIELRQELERAGADGRELEIKRRDARARLAASEDQIKRIEKLGVERELVKPAKDQAASDKAHVRELDELLKKNEKRQAAAAAAIAKELERIKKDARGEDRAKR